LGISVSSKQFWLNLLALPPGLIVVIIITVIIILICNAHSIKEISDWRRSFGMYWTPVAQVTVQLLLLRKKHNMLIFEFIFALLTILTFWLLLMQCIFSDNYLSCQPTVFWCYKFCYSVTVRFVQVTVYVWSCAFVFAHHQRGTVIQCTLLLEQLCLCVSLLVLCYKRLSCHRWTTHCSVSQATCCKRRWTQRRQLAVLKLSWQLCTWCDEKAEKSSDFEIRQKYPYFWRYPNLFVTQCVIRLANQSVQPFWCSTSMWQTHTELRLIPHYAYLLHMCHI